ncbi:MAG: hypothetical protein ACXAD7_10580 [Candidatus Kariarchaeaceae archaeon]|jgi:methyl-accepting chemotaxis protein
MTDINSTGVTFSFGLLALYGLYILYYKIIKSNGSLKDTESIHRGLILVGGLLIGLGLGGQEVSFGDDDFFSTETYFGILLFLAGLASVLLGAFYLKGAIWSPLEEISEYSAEFGEKFIATRLPISGGLELRRFSERFNENIVILANKISSFQIQMEFLEDRVKQTINSGLEVSEQSSSLSALIQNFSNYTEQQSMSLEGLENQLEGFISWYNETQVNLSEQFVDLRSIAELGNLLAVNAAIESSNLEVANPGFETIAAKLHDLAKSLEERQEGLRIVLQDVSLRYNDLNQNLSNKIGESLDTSVKIVQLAKQVNEQVAKLKQDEEGLTHNSNNLINVLTKVNQNIPKSY